MAKSRLEAEIVVTGARDAARDLGELERSLDSVGAGSSRAQGPLAGFANSLRATTDAQRNASRQTAMLLNNVSEMALGFGALDPRVRGITIAFAGASNSAFSLANSLNPVALVISTLTFALPALIGELSRTSNSMDNVGRSARNARTDVLSLVDALRQQERTERRRRNLLDGAASVEDIDARLSIARREAQGAAGAQIVQDLQRAGLGQLGGVAGRFITEGGDLESQLLSEAQRTLRPQDFTQEVRDRIASIGQTGTARRSSVERAIQPIVEQLQEAQAAELDEAVVELEEANQRFLDERDRERNQRNRRSRRSGREEDDPGKQKLLRIEADAIEAELDALLGIEEKQKAIIGLQIERERLARDTADAAERELENKEKVLARIESQAAAEERESARRKDRENEDFERRERFREQREAQHAAEQRAAQFAQVSAELAIGAVEALISGEEDAFEAFARRMAQEELYRGITATAEAIGNAIFAPQHAAAKAAQAGIHFGLAATLGGIGGGIGGGAPSAPSLPAGDRSGPTGDGGGGTTVINFGAPVASEEVGRMQSRADRAARRRFGRRS